MSNIKPFFLVLLLAKWVAPQNPWMFRDHMWCRPVTVHLQKIVQSEKSCEEACIDADETSAGNRAFQPDSCRRGGDVCEILSAEEVGQPPNRTWAQGSEEYFFNNDFPNRNMAIYEGGTDVVNFRIGCMPLSSNRRKKKSYKVVPVKKGAVKQCQCDLKIRYAAVRDSKDMLDCSSEAIRTRHSVESWQVVPDEPEDDNWQGCNILDVTNGCPAGWDYSWWSRLDTLIDPQNHQAFSYLLSEMTYLQALPQSDICKPYRDLFWSQYQRPESATTLGYDPEN
jgi:hypothetical protein